MALKATRISDTSIGLILENPLSKLRIDISTAFISDKGVTAADLQEVTTQLSAPNIVRSQTEAEVLKKEIANVQTVLAGKRILHEPDISYPSTQLLWGTALAHIVSSAGGTSATRARALAATSIWKQIVNSAYMKEELRDHAMQISDSVRNPRTRIHWGMPPTGYPDFGYYYDIENNQINLDLIWGLIGGIEHTRAANLHEIGHSQLTVKFTPKMMAIREEMDELEQASQERKLTSEEYKRLAMLNSEWFMRFLIFDEAENNVVDRYAVNQSQHMAQDYGWSRNNIETAIFGAGKRVLDYRANREAPDEEPAATDRLQEIDKEFINLKRAIRMSFFRNNGLFRNMEDEWQEIGVDPTRISAAARQPGTPAPSNDAAFAELLELCGGPKGLENLQPGFRDRLFGAGRFTQKVDEYSDRRNAIIDDIFDRYVDPLLQELLKEKERQLDKQLKDKARQNGNSSQRQPKPDPNADRGERGEDQPQDGSGTGKQDKDNATGKGQGNSQEAPAEPDGEENADWPQNSASDKRKRESQENADNENGTPGENASANEDDDAKDRQGSAKSEADKGNQQGKGQGKDGKSTEDGQEPNASQQGSEDPQGKDGQASGEGKSDKGDSQGNGQGSAGKSAEDGNDSRNGQAQRGKQVSGEPGDASGPSQNSDGNGEEDDILKRLLNPRSSDGEERVIQVEDVGDMPDIELPPLTPQRFERELQQRDTEKDAQAENDPTIGELASGTPRYREVLQKVELPVRGAGGRSYGSTYSDTDPPPPPVANWEEYQRLIAPHTATIQRVSELLRRIQAKQTMLTPQPAREREMLPEEGDLGRFDLEAQRDLQLKRMMGQDVQESDFNRFAVDAASKREPAQIDIGILIDTSGSMSGKPFENTITAACILYEAAKNVGINVYILALGDSKPQWLAKPGDNPVKIGQAIAGARKSIGGDKDYLAPAIDAMLKALTEKKVAGSVPVGSSYLFIVSDGLFTDIHRAVESVEKVAQKCPHVTCDFCLTNSSQTYIDQLAAKINRPGNPRNIGVTHIQKPDDIQAEIMKLLNARMVVPEQRAISYAEKIRELTAFTQGK